MIEEMMSYGDYRGHMSTADIFDVSYTLFLKYVIKSICMLRIINCPKVYHFLTN